MKPERHGASSNFNAAEAPVRSAVRYFLLSAALHLVLLAALIWVPASFPTPPRLPPGAISVNLVSLPGPASAAAGGGSAGEPPKPVEAPPPAAKPVVAAVEPAPKPVVEAPKPQVSIAPPKVREKKSLKEETKNTQKMIAKAIDRIEQSVKEPDTQSVTAAIDRIRKKLGETEPPAPARPGPPGAGGSGSGAGAGGGGGGGPGQIEPADIYRAEIAFQVEKNWAFSPQLAGSNKQLVASLVFKVLPNGEITDVRFTERSNNTYLDESAYRAVVKSSPVKPHPPTIKTPYVLVGIRFTPEGMR
ncbi:MAG: TonB C-terminal domain-containing protein [Desulfobacterales bacterium]|jgi:colicin import membrane protein|nr:TonB C-terminal domain-containing protein [Desulfobacterales bacterium]